MGLGVGQDRDDAGGVGRRNKFQQDEVFPGPRHTQRAFVDGGSKLVGNFKPLDEGNARYVWVGGLEGGYTEPRTAPLSAMQLGLQSTRPLQWGTSRDLHNSHGWPLPAIMCV
jgi:hypothetical protein